MILISSYRYSLVKSCWMDDPNARPSFKFLASEFEKLLGNNVRYLEMETKSYSNPSYCHEEETIQELLQSTDTQENTIDDGLGEPDMLDHLWKPPKVLYEIQDCSSRDTFSFSSNFLPPPGYDMPRPLHEATRAFEMGSRYENDLRFTTLTLRKSSLGTPSREVYTLPVKRGRSYMDMTAKANMAENCDKIEISKTISFKFSSILNMNEQNDESTA